MGGYIMKSICGMKFGKRRTTTLSTTETILSALRFELSLIVIVALCSILVGIFDDAGRQSHQSRCRSDYQSRGFCII